MNAQRIGIPILVRQLAHRLKVAHRHARYHQPPHTRLPGPRTHGRRIGMELGRVQVAMGVYP